MKKTNASRIIMLYEVLLSLLILLIICSCSKPSATILSDPTCSPPCWQNITPGKSTVEETRALLGNISLVDPDSIAIRGKPWYIYSEIFYFELRSKQVEGRIYFLENKVSMILFDGDLHITFGQFVV
jgi:hypothetical protein